MAIGASSSNSRRQGRAVSESEPTPSAGSRHPSFVCTPLVLPPQQHRFEDRAAAFHYGINASPGSPGFELPVRACGSSGDPLALQASSSQDAALFNDLFVQGREGGSSRPAEDEATLLKARQIQDKNKRAQQRYRVRQKEKMEDYKKQLDDLSKKVDQLMAEKASLESRTQLLEKVVRMKDEKQNVQIAELEECVNLDEWPMHNMAMRQSVYDVLALATNGDPGTTLEEMRHVSPQKMEQWHVEVVESLSQKLTHPEVYISGSDSHELVNKIVLGMRVTKMMGAKMHYVTVRKIELKWRNASVPTSSHPSWIKAILNVGLSSEQKQQLLGSHRRLLSRMDAIMRERTGILVAVGLTLPSGERPIISFDDCERSSDNYLQLSQVSDALKASLAKEHQAIVRFYEETQTEHSPLTPLQEARILVEIFPHRFETLDFCSILAMLEKQGAAAQAQGYGGDLSADMALPRAISGSLPTNATAAPSGTGDSDEATAQQQPISGP